MKKLIALALLGSLSAATNAAPVTITFDDPATETYVYYPAGLYPAQMTITKDGFVVTALGLIGSSGDKEAYGWTFENYGPGYTFPVSIRRSDGGAFALHSYDQFGASGVSYQLADGSQFYAEYSDIVGTDALLNVTGVAFFPSGAPYEPVTLDNIVVSAVPVPAAVWLFISALGLLGIRPRLSRT